MKSLYKKFNYFKDIILDHSLSQERKFKKLVAEYESGPEIFLEVICFSFKDPCDRSLLGYAVENNNAYIVNFLLSICSFRPKITDNKISGVSLLNREITGKKMIGCLGNMIVNQRDFFGNNALSYAALKGANKVLKILVNFGADINMTDDKGITPLSKAIQARNIQSVEIISKFGADSRITDKRGNNSWHLAAKQGNKFILEALLNHDRFLIFSVIAKNSDNLTPLCYISLQRNSVFLLKLTKKLSDISSKNPEQYEVFLGLAAKKNFKEIIRISKDLERGKISPNVHIYPEKTDVIHRAM